MLVATRTFITRDGDSEVRIFHGVSHVLEGHPIAVANPGSFASAPNRPRGARERVLAGGTARIAAGAPAARPNLGRERWRVHTNADACTFRDRPGSERVRLAASARRHLLEIADRTTAVDGLEAGGLLIGPVPQAQGLLEVVRVTESGPKAVRGRSRFVLDAEHDLALADEIREQSHGQLAVCGLWHTHPSGTRAPSRDDLGAFAALRSQVFNLRRVVGVIAVPAGDRWDLEGFITGSGFSRDLAVRASLN